MIIPIEGLVRFVENCFETETEAVAGIERQISDSHINRQFSQCESHNL